MDDAEARELQIALRSLQQQLKASLPPVEGVSRSAVRVLGLAARSDDAEDLRPGTIAQALSMATSNVAAALRELEAVGYITRHRASTDSRRIVVTLTDSGTAAVATHRALRDDTLREHVETVLTPTEQRTLSAAIPIIAKLANSFTTGTRR